MSLSTSHLCAQLLRLLAEPALRALALAALAGLALAVGRVKDAAVRLAVWTALLYAALAMPFLAWVAPAVRLPMPALLAAPSVPPAAPAGIRILATGSPVRVIAGATPSTRLRSAQPSASRWTFSWPLVAAALYLLIAGILLAQLAVGFFISRRVKLSAHPIGDRWVRAALLEQSTRWGLETAPELAESPAVAVPVTLGVWRPIILLPTAWRAWSEAKIQAVLAHELSHVMRKDALTRALAAIHRGIFWFSPLGWWLERHLAALAEQASDDAALRTVADRTLYAKVLLGFYQDLQAAAGRVRWEGMAMTSGKQAQRRVDRILDSTRPLAAGLRKPAWVALALLAAPVIYLLAAAQPAVEYLGKLKPDLVPNTVKGQTEQLEPATPQERAALPVPLAPGDRVFVGATFFRKNAPVKLALVEPAEGAPYLFADVNQNGSFETNERFSFEGPAREVILKVPFTAGPYRYYPIRLWVPEHDIYMSDTSGKAGAAGRTLLRSPFAFVEGTVDIGGQKTLVKYMFDLNENNTYPDRGWQGMDANGDGQIDEDNSAEYTFADNENVVFHVNGHDVTTVSLDLKSRTFVLRELPAGSDPLIQLHMGAVIPDFSFTDLDGKRHHFSEFRGKYVLLDFWGTWCGSCRRELPDLERVYQQFRERGLIILGMGDDKETEKARKVLSDADVTYPQSSGEVGSDLVHKRFRIMGFPTKMLLDPEGKVIARFLGGSLEREHLRLTLDKLLPAAK